MSDCNYKPAPPSPCCGEPTGGTLTFTSFDPLTGDVAELVIDLTTKQTAYYMRQAMGVVEPPPEGVTL